MAKKQVWYSRMSDAELDSLAEPFEKRAIDAKELRPMTPEMRRRWAAAKRKKPGRPKVGKGASRVLLSVEKGLLEEVNQYVRTRKISRSAFFADAVRDKLKRSA